MYYFFEYYLICKILVCISAIIKDKSVINHMVHKETETNLFIFNQAILVNGKNKKIKLLTSIGFCVLQYCYTRISLLIKNT